MKRLFITPLFPALHRWALTVCVAGGCFVMALATGCTSVEPPPRAPIPVTVALVEDRAEAMSARYSGTIEPAVTVPVAFRTSGYVREIAMFSGFEGKLHTLQSGDRVASGALLARIEDREYHSRLARSRAGVAEARAGLAMSKAQTASARATAHQAEIDFDRAQRLFSADSLTRVELDQARTKKQTTAETLAAAEASAVAAEAKIQAAGEAVNEVESVTDDTLLRASISGIVLRRQVEIGALVGPGTVGFVIGEVDQVKLTFAVPDRLLNQISLGATLSAILDAFPDEIVNDSLATDTPTSGKNRSIGFPGTVTRLAAAADPITRLFEVELRLPNRDGRLKPGMIAAVELGLAPQPRAGLVPLEAVVPARPDGHSYAVFVVETVDGRSVARRREVRLGRPVGNRIAVLTGVAAGERIVAAGAALLEDNDPIQPVEPMY